MAHAGADLGALSETNAATRDGRSAPSPARLRTKSPLVIKDVVLDEGQLLFVLSFRSPVWVNSDQAQYSGVSEFLKSRTLEDWSRVLAGRQPQRIDGSPLAFGEIDEVMDGSIVDMKLCANGLMFRFEADAMMVDADAMERLGLLDDAAGFCAEKSDWDFFVG